MWARSLGILGGLNEGMGKEVGKGGRDKIKALDGGGAVDQ